MRKPATALLSVLLILASFNAASSKGAVLQQNLEFANGYWFDGHTFRNRVFYSVNGVLTSRRPKRVDNSIDLKGGYVIPPFGEAHNHNIESANAEIIRKYLKDGYEASFLVLAGNPLEDFQNTGRIEMRVKQGMVLSLLNPQGSSLGFSGRI